jgi:hypothetical protein
MVERFISPVLRTEFSPTRDFGLSENAYRAASERTEAHPKVATMWQQEAVEQCVAVLLPIDGNEVRI